MSYVSHIYEQLAGPWNRDQLADQYRDASQRGERSSASDEHHPVQRSISMLATAVPACATLSVAVHVIHVVPAAADTELIDQLLGTVDDSSVAALHRCHVALELDGRAAGYSAEEWLPAVYETTAALLEGACFDRDPPSLVEYAEHTVSWLSRAIVELDKGSPEASSAIADVEARVLALQVFANMTRRPERSSSGR
jgi:hypothetical protein